MSEKTLFSNLKLALSFSSEIEEIARPLKEQFGVTSLVYGKNYSDGSEIRLTNQPFWIEYYYKNALYKINGFEQKPQKLQSGYAVWSHLSHHQPILQKAREFNIDHGMSLLNKDSDGYEFYFIGTTPDQPHVTNLLLNNLDFLHQFNFYFKEKAAKLLKKVNENRIIIPGKYEHVSSQERGLPHKNNSIDLQKLLSFKKVYLENGLTLSAREVACANSLVQGKSARIIAEELSLSPRTIETHLQHLKEKLQCHTKAELIQKIKALSLYGR